MLQWCIWCIMAIKETGEDIAVFVCCFNLRINYITVPTFLPLLGQDNTENGKDVKWERVGGKIWESPLARTWAQVAQSVNRLRMSAAHKASSSTVYVILSITTEDNSKYKTKHIQCNVFTMEAPGARHSREFKSKNVNNCLLAPRGGWNQGRHRLYRDYMPVWRCCATWSQKRMIFLHWG